MSQRRELALAVLAAAVLVAGVLVVAVDDGADDPPGVDSVDVGFLQDMIDHHEQAVLLSLIALRNEPSGAVRDLAIDVIASQREEIGKMEGWLILWGHERGQPSRQAMAWMGMRSTPATMPGMATRDELAALEAARGAALDDLFLTLMIVHHEGGIHMAEPASQEAEVDHVRFLAARIAQDQLREIRHMVAVQEAIAGTAAGDSAPT